MIKPIPTKSADGTPNGHLLLIHNDSQTDYRVAQVYATVVNEGCVKGPHRHNRRSGRFVCLQGDVKIVTRTWTTYTEHFSGQASGHNIVEVPAGMAAAIYNIGGGPAMVLNMPNKPWTQEDPDDQPVEGWDYKP